jgi:alkanesulfonate monooxygenase SsuD/methylene tetrahydromethanopterin reductase-like flavin-dependent oxidoreductase (luciferase family)
LRRPLRPPLRIVGHGQATSLDFLSDGRIVLAVAAGWLEKEFESLRSRSTNVVEAPSRAAARGALRAGGAFRLLSPNGRVVLRLTTLLADEPDPQGADERGRHAIIGPPQWIAERLADYVDSGCEGFVVNVGHEAPEFGERVQRFAEDVWPLVASARCTLKSGINGDKP